MRVYTRSLVLLCLVASACEGDEKPEETDTGSEPTLQDADGDGFFEDDDCDDSAPAVFPGAPEICNDLDDDCDALVDGDDSDLTGAQQWPADNDGDGYFSQDPADVVLACEGPAGEAGDCDDTNPAIYPTAPENDEADDQDENCNGWADETATAFADATFFRDDAPLSATPHGLGDIDGDGVADFTADGDHVFLGGARYSGELDVTETHDLALYGGIIVPAGDQDGDGLDDVWVQSDEAYLVVDLPSLLGQSVDGDSVAAAWTDADGGTILGEGEGDFDGDGVIDAGLLAFDYYWFVSTAHVMSGGQLGALGLDLAICDIGSPYYYMGASSVVPDLDGDGYGELLTFDAISLAIWPGGTTPGSSHGEAPRRITLPIWSQQDTEDLDGDSFPELIGCNDSDEICFVLRDADIPQGQSALEDVTWLRAPGLMRLIAIDLNGDGIQDLVGANRHADNGAGRIYLYDGATLPGDGVLETSEAIGSWRGEAPSAELGWKLDNVGDVDGDGYEDLMVASNYPPSGQGGKSYLVYGGPPSP